MPTPMVSNGRVRWRPRPGSVDPVLGLERFLRHVVDARAGGPPLLRLVVERGEDPGIDAEDAPGHVPDDGGAERAVVDRLQGQDEAV